MKLFPIAAALGAAMVVLAQSSSLSDCILSTCIGSKTPAEVCSSADYSAFSSCVSTCGNGAAEAAALAQLFCINATAPAELSTIPVSVLETMLSTATVPDTVTSTPAGGTGAGSSDTGVTGSVATLSTTPSSVPSKGTASVSSPASSTPASTGTAAPAHSTTSAASSTASSGAKPLTTALNTLGAIGVAAIVILAMA